MPTYDYPCVECGHRFEHFQNMSDALLETRPECGGKLRRLIGTGAAVIFKGSGFLLDRLSKLPAELRAQQALLRTRYAVRHQAV